MRELLFVYLFDFFPIMIKRLLLWLAINSVSSAWIGVNELNGAPLSFVSNPDGTLTYSPTWASPTDATKKCVTVSASNGEWSALDCQGSPSNQATLCRIPLVDGAGYNVDTSEFISH